MFRALARLVWEHRADRARMVELLDRFDRDRMAAPADMSWLGWQDAIVYLGLAEFEPRMRVAWDDGRVPFFRELDRKDWLDGLASAVAHPDDPGRMVQDGVAPLEDPVVALARLADSPRRELPQFSLDDPDGDAPLTDDEMDWMAGFLVSRQVPAGTMPLERLDGYFAAAAAGSGPVSWFDLLERVWALDDEGPRFDTEFQRIYVDATLARHFYSLPQLILSAGGYRPWLGQAEPQDRAREWALGFTLGMDFNHDDWQSLMTAPGGANGLLAPLGLLLVDADRANAPSLAERETAIEALPRMLRDIRRYWHDGYAPRVPVRSHKVGRNEPCPCGSGRKYKKCCGAVAGVAR